VAWIVIIVNKKSLLALCLLGVTSLASAGEKEDRLVDKVVAAYGGDALIGMNSLIVRDRYKTISAEGGVRPGLDAVSRLHSKLTVDFAGGRKAVKNWAVRNTGKRLGQIMFDGHKGWSINFLRGSHVERPDLNGNNVGAGMMRLLDTTLARMLYRNRDAAEYLGAQQYQAKAHDRVRVSAGGGADLTLFIEQETGLIARMVRGNSDYRFSEHRTQDGITYASDTNVMREGRPSMVTLSRVLEINPDVSAAFDLPRDTKKLEGMRDTSEMDVVTVTDGVYSVGKGFSASLFVDVGDHFIGVGGLGGIEARLAALQAELGTDKPLRLQVLPEHQPGHNGGVNKIAALGATFIVAESHLQALKSKLTETLADDRFTTVEDTATFGGGKVLVYDIATLQSEHYLLAYVPAAKLVFSVDEFGSNLKNSVPSADKRMISYRQAIEALGLDVEKIAYIHGTGILTMQQLRDVTDGYKEGYCPTGHDICRDNLLVE
jgi:hypothetical protein